MRSSISFPPATPCAPTASFGRGDHAGVGAVVVNQAALKTKRAALQPLIDAFRSPPRDEAARLATRDGRFEAELAALTRYARWRIRRAGSGARDPRRVRVRGDEAVLDYTRKFDRIAARSLAELEVPREKLQRALEGAAREQAGALREAGERIRTSTPATARAPGTITDQDGTALGQRVTALDRVGISCPAARRRTRPPF